MSPVSVRKPRLRTVLLIAMIPVVALFVGMGVAVILPSSSSPSHGQMTREQLFEAAAGPNAAPRYDYYFSQEELKQIAPHIQPYNCDPNRSLTDAEQYHCGIDSLFTLDSLHYIPKGYMYEGALLGVRSHTLAGIRIVRQATVSPTVQHV